MNGWVLYLICGLTWAVVGITISVVVRVATKKDLDGSPGEIVMGLVVRAALWPLDMPITLALVMWALFESACESWSRRHTAKLLAAAERDAR